MSAALVGEGNAVPPSDANPNAVVLFSPKVDGIGVDNRIVSVSVVLTRKR